MEVGRSLRLACEKILFLLECKEVVAVINRLVAAVGARGGEEWSFLLEREKIGARLQLGVVVWDGQDLILRV